MIRLEIELEGNLNCSRSSSLKQIKLSNYIYMGLVRG